MRLDLFLKRTGLLKHRAVAKETCDRGEVRVDGSRAKASKDIVPGSRIEIGLPREFLEIRVKGLPDRNYKHSEGEAFYEVVSRSGKGLFS